MLVFGESILNDAVAIVLTTTIVESSGVGVEDAGLASQVGRLGLLLILAALPLGSCCSPPLYPQVFSGIFRFFVMFFGSAGIGTLVAMLSSLVLKYIDLYTNPR